MTLDGHPIALGSSVYDVAYGPGSVTNLNGTSNSFTVDFSTPGRSMIYVADNGAVPGGVGTRFQARTLFWQEPIVVAPPPASFVNSNGVGWTKMKTVLKAAYAAFQ